MDLNVEKELDRASTVLNVASVEIRKALRQDDISAEGFALLVEAAVHVADAYASLVWTRQSAAKNDNGPDGAARLSMARGAWAALVDDDEGHAE
jgi:hypothetical protein